MNEVYKAVAAMLARERASRGKGAASSEDRCHQPTPREECCREEDLCRCACLANVATTEDDDDAANVFAFWKDK